MSDTDWNLVCHTCDCHGHNCCCQSILQMNPGLHQEGCRNKKWDELAANGPLLPALSDPDWKPDKQ